MTGSLTLALWDHRYLRRQNGLRGTESHPQGQLHPCPSSGHRTLAQRVLYSRPQQTFQRLPSRQRTSID